MNEFEQYTGFEVEANYIRVLIKPVAASYAITFQAGGIGTIMYMECESDSDEKFTHKLNIAEAQANYPRARDLENFVTQYFWKEVNPTLQDPFWSFYDEPGKHNLEFTRGNRAEFDRLMRLFIITEPEPDLSEESRVIVRTAAPAVSSVYWDHLERNKIENGMLKPQLASRYYYSERLEDLVEILLDEHHPYGFVFEYTNNGRSCRKSSYSPFPLHLEYHVEKILEAPAREKMAARQELSKWLIERGQNPAEYGLDWEKIV